MDVKETRKLSVIDLFILKHRAFTAVKRNAVF